MQFEFDQATAMVQREAGRYDADIFPGWDINGNANGGYLLALAGKAMRDLSGRPDPISVTAHYLAPGPAGPITVSADTIKSGRQLVTMSGSIQRGDRQLLRVIGSFGDIATSSGGFSYNTMAPPDLPPIEQCTKHMARREGAVIGLADRINVFFRPEHAPFRFEQRPGVALIEGWAAFADGRPFDTLSLLLVVDALPPPVFNIDIPEGWVPTVELTAHIRGIPAPGPLRCRFHTEIVQNGFMQEDGEVWDSAGQLVAQSRQLALVPRG